MILFAENEDLNWSDTGREPEDEQPVDYKSVAGTQSSLRVSQPPQPQGGGNPMGKVFDILGGMAKGAMSSAEQPSWSPEGNTSTGNSTQPINTYTSMEQVQQAGDRSYLYNGNVIGNEAYTEGSKYNGMEQDLPMSPATLNRLEQQPDLLEGKNTMFEAGGQYHSSPVGYTRETGETQVTRANTSKYEEASAMPLTPQAASAYIQGIKPEGNIVYEAGGKDFSTPSMVQDEQGIKSVVATTEQFDYDLSKLPLNEQKWYTALGKVESNNKYFIRPNKHGYEGKYQFRFRKGDDGLKYIRKMGITREQWRKSPKLQEQMMQLITKDYDKDLKHYGLPVNNYTRWLRHNQGAYGASRIMKGRLTPLVRRNIRAQAVHGRTDIELIRNYHKKFAWRFR